MDVSPGINIFLGPNGQGKTNLLEGLGFMSLGRSHRGSRDREIVGFGAEGFYVGVEGRDASGRGFSLEATFSRAEGKRLKADGQPVARMADLVGKLPAVLFNPDEIGLAKGSPEHRRRYLDYTLSVTSADYLRRLLDYRRVVAQKNRLLKARGRTPDRELDAWDEELADCGAPLMSAREALLPDLAQAAADAYAALASPAERGTGAAGGGLELSLETTAPGTPGEDSAAESTRVDPPALAGRLRQALSGARPRERQLGFGVVGPHRDRLRLRLRGRSLRRFGSQGEMRSAAIALKLAQAEFIYQRTRERPVVFLDDIFSELDHRRSEALQRRLLAEHQLFVATARPEDVAGLRAHGNARVWRVSAGRLSAATPEVAGG